MIGRSHESPSHLIPLTILTFEFSEHCFVLCFLVDTLANFCTAWQWNGRSGSGRSHYRGLDVFFSSPSPRSWCTSHGRRYGPYLFFFPPLAGMGGLGRHDYYGLGVRCISKKKSSKFCVCLSLVEDSTPLSVSLWAKFVLDCDHRIVGQQPRPCLPTGFPAHIDSNTHSAADLLFEKTSQASRQATSHDRSSYVRGTARPVHAV